MAAKVSRRRQERDMATGLAARLERAAQSGKLRDMAPSVGPRPVGVGRRAVARNDYREPDAAQEREELELEYWAAELLPVDPADLAHALSQSLVACEAEDADLDQLWDWIRADEDRGQRFLSQAPATSSAMRGLCKQFDVLYALYDTAEGKTHVGFAGFQFLPPNHAVTDLYLATTYRGQAPHLMPQLMAMAEQTYPDKTFVVHTTDAAMARMLRGVGFEVNFLLKWIPKPPPLAGVDGEIDGTGDEPEPEPQE